MASEILIKAEKNPKKKLLIACGLLLAGVCIISLILISQVLSRYLTIKRAVPITSDLSGSDSKKLNKEQISPNPSSNIMSTLQQILAKQCSNYSINQQELPVIFDFSLLDSDNQKSIKINCHSDYGYINIELSQEFNQIEEIFIYDRFSKSPPQSGHIFEMTGFQHIYHKTLTVGKRYIDLYAQLTNSFMGPTFRDTAVVYLLGKLQLDLPNNDTVFVVTKSTALKPGDNRLSAILQQFEIPGSEPIDEQGNKIENSKPELDVYSRMPEIIVLSHFFSGISQNNLENPEKALVAYIMNFLESISINTTNLNKQ